MLKTRFARTWEAIHTSFWIVPAVMGGVAILLGMVGEPMDRWMGTRGFPGRRWFYAGEPEEIRLVLSTIAGSIITVTGVLFSITVVVLSFASAQLGPRILRVFAADRGTQVVLGIFIATFLYCIVLLARMTSGGMPAVSRSLSVSIALLLSLLSIASLIYYIHHLATRIRADSIIAGIHAELRRVIDDSYPPYAEGDHPRPGSVQDLTEGSAHRRFEVRAATSGYLQAVDYERLAALAARQDFRLDCLLRPGHYVMEREVIGVAFARGDPGEDVLRRIDRAFVRGRERTGTQDVEYGVTQLVEIALRALSPGINDPFTAMSCVDHLGEALAHLARRGPAPRIWRDRTGTPRIHSESPGFADVADRAFHQIRQAARDIPAVLIRMLETIAKTGSLCRTPRQRESLRKHARLIWATARGPRLLPADRRDLERRYRDALAAVRT